MSDSFKRLDPNRIVATAAQLERRITERFPGSSLSRVAAELVQVAREATNLSDWLAQPLQAVRFAIALLLAGLGALVLFALTQTRFELSNSFAAWAGSLEATINDLIFVGIAAYFLLGVERRLKRRRAHKALHVLRSLAHVVDMHQLTKDPDSLNRKDDLDTESSPERTLTAFELTRYLDYCSELLALMSKVAVLYVQHFDDPETLETAGNVEDLTVGLSRNIWQKIMILDRVTAQS